MKDFVSHNSSNTIFFKSGLNTIAYPSISLHKEILINASQIGCPFGAIGWKSVWNSSKEKECLGAKLCYSQWNKNMVFKLQNLDDSFSVKLCIRVHEFQFSGQTCPSS